MNKVLYVFDLDDTLIRSEAKIQVYRNGAFYKSLTPQLFNTFIKGKTDVFDFTDFKDGELVLKADKYKMWPFLKKLNKLIKSKKIAADIIILTARSSEVKSFIHTLLNNDGISIDISHIITLGDDKGDVRVADEKKKILQQLIKKYSKIIFFDDDIQNIKMANTIPNIKTKLVEGLLNNKVNEAIKHLSPKTEEDLKKINPSDKIEVGIDNNMLWLVQDGIKEGGKISDNAIYLACYKKLDDIIYLFLKQPGISPTNKLKMACEIKDISYAEKAINDGALIWNTAYYPEIALTLHKVNNFNQFIENNNNNATFLAHIYYYLPPDKKHVVEKIVNSYNANKTLTFGFNSRSTKYVEKGIKMGATNVNIGHNQLIQSAAENGHLALVKTLLKSPHVNPGDNTKDGIRYGRDESDWAIRQAAKNGHVEVVKLLLKDKRVNPAAKNNFALRHAARNGHTDVVKTLLKDKRVIKSLSTSDLIKILKLAK